jgi:glutamate N-acetyltransferase/amino-acid N-acetyltransferase
MQDALQSCDWLAEKIACNKEDILPFSTGVIGESLPMVAIKQGIQTLSEKLLSEESSSDQWLVAARGIMTTDTVAKAVSKQVTIEGKTVTITGIAKGSGMICPDMATMLAFIATDAKVDESYLRQCLKFAVAKSFNSITVDGDTSTNDACVLVATGHSGISEINADNKDAELFLNALDEVCIHLAQAVIRDAEGATKFVEINVKSASTVSEARDVAYAIAHSLLVKTALFASDPNWGRILAAVGRAGIEDLVLEDVSIYLDDVCIVSEGSRAASYTEEQGQKVMNQSEISINVNLSRGDSQATIWTSDLSHEYVTINSEYRT